MTHITRNQLMDKLIHTLSEWPKPAEVRGGVLIDGDHEGWTKGPTSNEWVFFWHPGDGSRMLILREQWEAAHEAKKNLEAADQ